MPAKAQDMGAFDARRWLRHSRRALLTLYLAASAVVSAIVFWECLAAQARDVQPSGVLLLLVLLWLAICTVTVIRAPARMVEPVRLIHEHGTLVYARILLNPPPIVRWCLPVLLVEDALDKGGSLWRTWCFALPSQARQLRRGQHVSVLDVGPQALQLGLPSWLRAALPCCQGDSRERPAVDRPPARSEPPDKEPAASVQERLSGLARPLETIERELAHLLQGAIVSVIVCAAAGLIAGVGFLTGIPVVVLFSLWRARRLRARWKLQVDASANALSAAFPQGSAEGDLAIRVLESRRENSSAWEALWRATTEDRQAS